MHRFFVPDISSDQKVIILPEEESKHATKVLRLKEGDTIELINGKGDLFTCELILPGKRAEVKVLQHLHETPDKQTIHIAIAPTKNIDRLEWFLEKATEIGVDEVSLLLCENSERKIVKMERLEKILVSATKQSKRLYKPILHDLLPFKTFIEQIENGGFIAHCEENRNRTELRQQSIPDDFLMLIGPEGDFSPGEIELALTKNFQPVTLGKNRLRTETAGVYVVSLAKIATA